MISSVTYGNGSAILGLTAKQSSKGYQANSTDNTSASEKNSVAANSTAQPGSGVLTYDFTNMTPAKMLTTVNCLIKSGQMSLDESSSLVGLMGGVSPLSKVNYDGKVPDTANKPMDFVAALKQMLSFDQSINNASGVVYDNKALSVLERLQGAPSSVNLSV